MDYDTWYFICSVPCFIELNAKSTFLEPGLPCLLPLLELMRPLDLVLGLLARLLMRFLSLSLSFMEEGSIFVNITGKDRG